MEAREREKELEEMRRKASEAEARAREAREETAAEIEAHQRSVARLETQMDGYRTEIVADRRKEDEYRRELEKVEEEMAEAEARLEEAEGKYRQAKVRCRDLELEKTGKEKLQGNWYGGGVSGRVGRSGRGGGRGDFRSEEERQEWERARNEELMAAKKRQTERLATVEVGWYILPICYVLQTVCG